MFGNHSMPPPPLPAGLMLNASGGPGGQSHGGSAAQAQTQKHDIFVGNLAFNTTEEQLHQVFSEIGRVIKVRMVTDSETGKPRGFSFVEFEDPQAALAAIRNMNDYELNGRSLRVNFSNSSHLETLANQLGMDMTQKSTSGAVSSKDPSSKNKLLGIDVNAGNSTQAVADAIRALSRGEMWDVLFQLKAIADRDPDEARKLLCVHPQLPEAILHLMSKMDMVQAPLPTSVGVAPSAGPEPTTHSTATSADPRLRASASAAPTTIPMVTDPRQARSANALPVPVQPSVDSRTRSSDPRMLQPPPPPPPSFPQPPPAPPTAATAQLDPALVQQVMSLTPAQIAQLPPDKQQSILALRHQITGGR